MDYEEFKERLNWGEEFEFEYNSKNYWISVSQDGEYILNDYQLNFEIHFQSVKDLLNNAKVDGMKISEIWDQIKNNIGAG